MACARLWGLTSYNFRRLRSDPISMIHEHMYPRSGVRDPPTQRIAVKPHLSFMPGHAAGHLTGWCSCQGAPLAPYLRPGVGQCLCLPADGGPILKNEEHSLSKLSKYRRSPYQVIPFNVNPRRKYKQRFLPLAASDVLTNIETKTSAQRQLERQSRERRRALQRR